MNGFHIKGGKKKCWAFNSIFRASLSAVRQAGPTRVQVTRPCFVLRFSFFSRGRELHRLVPEIFHNTDRRKFTASCQCYKTESVFVKQNVVVLVGTTSSLFSQNTSTPCCFSCTPLPTRTEPPTLFSPTPHPHGKVAGRRGTTGRRNCWVGGF